MLVTIIGAHGQIARLLTRLLRDAGHSVRGVVRSQRQFGDVRADGAQPTLCDLEHASPAEIEAALDHSDVVVFAAGAGPGSGPDRKATLDRDGAIAAVDAAVRVGARRFVLVSAMGTDDPPLDDSTFSVYLRAKAAADGHARSAPIPSTIVRPGRLTDDEPTGAVTLARHVAPGEIPRADVASVLCELIATGLGTDATVEVVGGRTPIPAAVTALAGMRPSTLA